jgi:hypothetical protein
MGVKWNRVFLIKLAQDESINATAKMYWEWGKVPANQKWSRSAEAGWQPLKQGCFKKIVGVPPPTLQDKVMVIAHGSKESIGEEEGWGLTGPELADYFAYWGLTEIGLLTFKCCNVGAGDFLPAFKRACARHLIKVGWLKGYRGPTVTDKSTVRSKRGKPTVTVRDPERRKQWEASEPGPPALVAEALYYVFPLSGADRIRIVPGNAAHQVPDALVGGSRYNPALFQEVGD